MQKTLIYCRVSSQRQVDEGHGNQSQELRCKKYAEAKEYKVEKVFPDSGVSGRLFERPAMRELLSYLDKHINEKYVVIFDDLSRFARDLNVHLKLKTEFKSRNVKLECLNFNFEDSPEGVFIENVLASKAQLDREQNRRQVIQKMKARLDQGFWPFCYPPALINVRDPIRGRILYAHEPKASIFKEAIENYRDGLLNTLEQVTFFINTKYKEHNIDKKISISGTDRMLKNILYAGWIEYEPWGIEKKKGKHDGFVTIETFEAVQQKLLGKSKARLRKDYNLDFPLRNYVTCDFCKKTYTASWSTGRSSRYPHYFCKNSECQYKWKTVLKYDIETKFENLLNSLTPNSEIIGLIKDLFIDVWNKREKGESNQKKNTNDEIYKLEQKKIFFKERLPSAKNEYVIKDYEEELIKINKNIEELQNSQSVKNYTNENFGTACDSVIGYIKDPVLMWQSPNYKDKRLLLEMYFEEKIPYNLSSGFGTVSLACLPKLLTTKPDKQNSLVEMPGIGPGSGETLIYKRLVRDKVSLLQFDTQIHRRFQTVS